MSEHDSSDSAPSPSLGAPEHNRSGSTIDDAVAKSEAGSEVEGVHTPSGDEEPGESRVEQMPEVAGVTEGRVDGNPGAQATPPQPGPSPVDAGSGGAQRIVGARISDRIAGGEPAPQGPPFDADPEGDGQAGSVP